MPEGLTGREWRVAVIAGSVVAGEKPLAFSIAADGTVSGSGGCNRLMGRATIDGSAVRFDPVATTRMACAPEIMQQESRLLAALESVRGWRIDGDALELLDAVGASVIRGTRPR